MSAGLEASTVTPGRTAPDASVTTPAMEACAVCGCRQQHGGEAEQEETQSALNHGNLVDEDAD